MRNPGSMILRFIWTRLLLTNEYLFVPYLDTESAYDYCRMMLSELRKYVLRYARYTDLGLIPDESNF